MSKVSHSLMIINVVQRCIPARIDRTMKALGTLSRNADQGPLRSPTMPPAPDRTGTGPARAPLLPPPLRLRRRRGIQDWRHGVTVSNGYELRYPL